MNVGRFKKARPKIGMFVRDVGRAEQDVSLGRLDLLITDREAMVLKHPHRTAHEIFGSPDDLKFRSCLTLFDAAAPNEPLFREALDVFYQGLRDPRTTELLRG